VILPPLLYLGGMLRVMLHARASRKCRPAEFSLFTDQRERERNRDRERERETKRERVRQRERESETKRERE
jgi:hypothetical protein